MPGHKINKCYSTNKKPFSKDRSPLMLQDYLNDDISSCSSNGFKSFPRHQCCPTTTVRSKPKPHKYSNNPKPTLFHKSRRHSTSAFHKASEAVIKAVKSLQFNSSGKKSLHLPRSLSRRLLRKSFFWRRDGKNVVNVDRESGRWRSFYEFLKEQDQAPLPREIQLHHGTGNSAIGVVGRVSTSSSSSQSKSNSSNSCCESEFTAESYNNAGKNELPCGKAVSEGEGATTGVDSSAKQTWRPNEEKEQFSPVSILDCPFMDEQEEEEEAQDHDDDDEKEVNSPFHQNPLVHVQGTFDSEAKGRTKMKLMRKLRRFERLDELKPLDLEKRITVIELDSSSSSSTERHSEVEEERLVIIRKDPHELLSMVKERAESSSSKGLISKCELLLLDFFEEKLELGKEWQMKEELETVEEWVNGEEKEMFNGWEVKESRNVYLKHMDVNGEWSNVGERKEEVGLELENHIFDSLIHQVFLLQL
ncbi:hypothetical protein LINPERHAP2_LOCUS15920 [Linum perenne]